MNGRKIEMVSTTEFPIVSVANIHSDFDNVAKQLFDASCKWGFFVATDHGISNVDRIFDLVRLLYPSVT